jgi:hypothetical protein
VIPEENIAIAQAAKSRDDFALSVKELLAKRVRHECSNPDCRRPTSGPQEDPLKAINIGVAAHISAASSNGPRFNSSMSAEARAAIDNGIWLCQNCGKLVDNDPIRFPVDLLKCWKTLAEHRAARALEESRAPERQEDRVDSTQKPLPELRKEMRREWRDIAYFPVPGHWSYGDRRDPNTKQGILLWLAIPPASKGQKGTPARDLVAQLTFHHIEGTTRVPRAYWLEKRGHQIDIGNGYESAVVVGYFDPYSSNFFSHENHYQDEGGNDFFAEAFRQLGKRYEISSERSFTVEVSIIDANSNETIEQKRLEITMPQRILNMVDLS